MKPDIYLIGVGNYTDVIIELAEDCGYEVKGLYHYNEDRVGEIVLGVKIIASTDSLFKENLEGKNFAVTIGENTKRQILADKIRSLGGVTPNLIHPKAVLSRSTRIGYGCFILLNSYLWTKSTIGNDCIISAHALVVHHATVGNACYIASFSAVGAYSKIGDRVFFGMNSIILPKGLTLGNDCVVGAKANVTRSFEANTVLVGNPAKKI